MYQIDVASASPILPAPSAAGVAGFFTDGSVAGGVEATVVPADFLNAVMLEMLNVVTAGGLVPTKAATGQMVLAIQNLIEARSGNYALDTGLAGAYVVALDPVLKAYPNGLQVRFRAKRANGGASTLDAGAGPVPLLREDGQPTQQGDIPNNGVVSVTYDLAANAFLLNSIVASQLGALARMGIGAGLADDGAGNLITTGQSYINAVVPLARGSALVDTSAGPLQLPLPANPPLGAIITLSDARGTWGTNNVTLLRNGKNIMGFAQDLIVNVSDIQFTIWYNGTEWRLV